MNESEATTLERIHAAAEKEFLEHGFQAASLRRIVKEAKGLFIPALAQYAEEVVEDAWRGSFAPLLDLPGVIRRVEREGMVCATFRRRDGAWIRLQVMRYLPDEDEGGGTLWIFSAADADEQRA